MFQANPVSGENGFFSTLGGTVLDVAQSVGDSAREVLPVWVKTQLNQQLNDQLADPKFNPALAANRLPDGIATTSAETVKIGVTDDVRSTNSSTESFVDSKKVGFIQFGGVSIDGLSVALAVVGSLGVFFLLKRR